MKRFDFYLQKKSRLSYARTGILKTPHGMINTPAFVTVGTKGTVKALAPEDLADTGTQFIFANTYHLVLSPGLDVIKKAEGIHTFSHIDKPIITDSGGFQVFSLGRISRSSRHISQRIFNDENENPYLVKITEDGVTFRSHINGDLYKFTPEFSIEAQKVIGADIIVAFDECTYLGASKKYTEQATQRTYDWAVRSLHEFNKKVRNDHIYNQKMYGVIQGGLYKNLREKSAVEIASLPFFGLALGGISVGETKKELFNQIDWIMNILHSDPRPRHALGISSFDDIIKAVKKGIDTFDCVLPTRDGRVGKLYIQNPKNKLDYNILDITKSLYKKDLQPIDKTCSCYTCKNFSRAYLHHLHKQRELLAYRLGTIHNLYMTEKFFENLRKKIIEGSL